VKPIEFLKQSLPIATWLPQYKLSNLRWDIIAGLTLASFVLPESMAYATMAGVPPEAGIYCCIAGGLFYALFTSTKQVAVGPTSAMSLMVATTVATLSDGDVQRWGAIASLTALTIFIFCVISYFLRLSSLVSFISEDVLLGFKAGAALLIMATQLPKLFGINSGGDNFFGRMYNLFQELPETNIQVLLFGLAAFILLQVGHRLAPGRPISLIVVVLSVLVFSLTDIVQYGFEMTGELPIGLPPLQIPSLRFEDLDGVLTLAMGCFLMGYIETVSVARTFAEKNNATVNPRQELLALGAANFGAAFASGYPVAGGLSQSTVNDKAGARTPLTLIICSAVLVVMMLNFTHLLRNLPQVVLAAVVLDAVLGLIKVKSLKNLYYLKRDEFGISLIAIVAVLFFGILKGVLIAAICSIIVVLIRSKLPNIAVLGQIPGTDKYSDIKRNPDNVEIPHLKIIRIESSIFYFNEENVHDTIIELIVNPEIKHVILDLSSTPYIDVAGAKMLSKITTELKDRFISVKIVGALAVARDMLRKLGLEEQIGHISRRDSMQDEVLASKAILSN
jgi:high affinity sulfate transporter 1